MTEVVALTDPPLIDRLTPRELAFIRHPLVATDPVGAAVAVGYAPATAERRARYMRRTLDFFIKHYEDQRMARINVSQERVRQELAMVAFADITDYYDVVDVDGDTVKILKDPTRLPEVMRRAIKNIEFMTVTAKDGTTYQQLLNIELHPKLDALKQLAEYMGMKNSKPAGEDDNSDDRTTMEHMTPEELEGVMKTYTKAAERAKAAASKKRDKAAIPGETTNGKA